MATNPNEYFRSGTDQDLLPVVDENDVVVGAAPRRDVHMRHLKHRAVHIVVANAAGEVLLQKRSRNKDSHPGWWDVSVGGHVDVEEDYDAAARRELREELGAEGVLRLIAKRPATIGSGWEFVQVYECLHEGPFDHNRTEIDEVRWVPAELILREGHSDPDRHGRRITGSGLESIRVWARAVGLA
jgi:isopentenyldiphosphate isomerase